MRAPRIPGSRDPIEQFILGLVFLIGVPLLPLVLEFWIRSSVSITSLSLTASIYNTLLNFAGRGRMKNSEIRIKSSDQSEFTNALLLVFRQAFWPPLLSIPDLLQQAAIATR
jgi:hypothetical protein